MENCNYDHSKKKVNIFINIFCGSVINLYEEKDDHFNKMLLTALRLLV